MSPTAAMNQDAHEVVRNTEHARAAIQHEDWSSAERFLTEAQDRIGRLLREVGEKQREVLQVPAPEEGDRG